MINCAQCDVEFDPDSRYHKAVGRYHECHDCASGDDEPRRTGIMVFGGKNSVEIQINKDPALTKYMRKARMGSGTAPGIVTRKQGGSVAKVVSGLENRRHGDSK